MNILVTGANGQLGREMRITARNSRHHYIFTDAAPAEGLDTTLLDITDRAAVERMVSEEQVGVQKSIQYIREAEVLIIGGTSLVVYPAAGLIDYFRGKHLVVINRDATPRDTQADLLIQEKIGVVFSQI